MTNNGQKGWLMTCLGTCVNLCSVLYVWSVIKAEIAKEITKENPEWTWNPNYMNLPYSIGTLIFACSNVPAGYFYDKVGPRIVTTVGGILQTVGLLLCSLSSELWVWVIGYGVLTCAGLGACYSVQTPTAVKWFPATRTGLIAGIVVGGFGIGPVYLSPLTLWLVGNFGILGAMRYLAMMVLVVIVPLAQFLEVPPPPVPEPPAPETNEPENSKSLTPSFEVIRPTTQNFTFSEALRTPTLWLCWLLLGIGGGTGIMMIAEASPMASKALKETSWIALVVLSIGNCAGRVLSGILNDRIGLRQSLFFFFSAQALMMSLLKLIPKDNIPCVLFVATGLGFNYGAFLTLFSVATKFFFGTLQYGMIFGVVLTGWGFAGFLLPNISQIMKRNSGGSIDASAIMGACLLLIGDVLILFLDPPQKQKSLPKNYGTV